MVRYGCNNEDICKESPVLIGASVLPKEKRNVFVSWEATLEDGKDEKIRDFEDDELKSGLVDAHLDDENARRQDI